MHAWLNFDALLSGSREPFYGGMVTHAWGREYGGLVRVSDHDQSF